MDKEIYTPSLDRFRVRVGEYKMPKYRLKKAQIAYEEILAVLSDLPNDSAVRVLRAVKELG